MNDTAEHSTDLEPLRNALSAIGLSNLLGPDFVARERVGVRYREIATAAARFGYVFKHEDGNVYGRVKLEPIDTIPVPIMRIITRSDHVAVHGSRRVA